MRIKKVKARQVLDSRGNPTIEVEVLTTSSVGSAMVPSGASTGIHEAHELRDGKKEYNGKGVLNAIKKVEGLDKELHNFMVDGQKELDEKLIEIDGTANKSNLGANSILGVSMAASRCAATAHKMHLFEYLGALYDNDSFVMPIPFANILNGGEHAGNSLNFQEFMIVPVKAKNFKQATQMVVETYHVLKGLLKKKYGSSSLGVGDEGGFAPDLAKPEEALDIIMESIKKAGYKGKIKIALDPAASEFFDGENYEPIQGVKMSPDELVKYYLTLIKKYPIISIEDAFDQDDFDSWKKLTKKTKIQIVGDDLTVSNEVRIGLAVEKKLCNALLLKINQIGSITEAMRAAHKAQLNGWNVMVSHRSGETEDSYISDLAVAIACGQIKLGAPSRGERTAKYNQLIRIEEYLGKVKYGRL